MHHDIIETYYMKYYRAAYLYALSLCGQKETAEDIVSQAFEKAFISLPDERKDFKYWLLAVCKNLWIDELRKSKRFDQSPIEKIEIETTVSTIAEILNDEKNRKLYLGINRLPANYREILTLYYFAGVPLLQIASILNLSNSNVKTAIYRARVKLKKYLEEDGYEF